MLIRYLESLPDSRILWQFGGSTNTVADVSSWLDGRKSIGDFQDKFVVLAVKDPLKLSFLMVLLDGLASKMLLLPSEFLDNSCPFDLDSMGVDFIFIETSAHESVLTKGDCNVIEIDEWFCSTPERPLSPAKEFFIRSDTFLTRWVIPTSGTTGTPKLITHTLESLSRSVKSDIKKGGDFSWGLMYQLSRFAGLQVFLQSFMSGSKLVFTDPADSPSSILNDLEAGQCNALSATPTMYRKLMMTGLLARIKLKQITLGGEIADQQVLNSVKRLYPDARVIHVYASTEAGVGFSVTDGLAGFPDSYVDENISGVDIKVSDDGILLLRPPTNNRSIGDVGIDVAGLQGYIISGDKVKNIDGRYHFLGRSNGTINVGGNKVQPEEIELVIGELPEISLVSVHGKKNPISGELVVAKVLPFDDKRDHADIKRLVINHCKDRLTDYKIPAIVRVVSNIETTVTGKIKRE
jgi:acyl-CoA synthetase (AMP-forming)/AMP-acid ligase II